MWLKEYERLLLDPTASFQDIVEFKAKHLPTRLFRYSSPTEYALKSVEESQIWLTAPRLFNDGYDSALQLDHRSLVNHLRHQHLSDAIDKLNMRDKITQLEIESLQTASNQR